MKKILLIIISFFIWGCQSQKKVVNVLFVGNSLTYYNNMPQLLQEMLNETDPNIKIDQITFPGASLQSHIDYMVDPNKENSRYEKKQGDTTSTERKLLLKPWDVVILQEGTVRLLIPEVRDSLVIPSIRRIKGLVTNKACKFVLFHTWVSKHEYPKEYCYSSFQITRELNDEKFCSENFINLEQEAKSVDKEYTLVAQANGIDKSKNGNMANRFLKSHPEIEIFDDYQHPSVEGAFLNACIFYEILTDKKANKLKFNAELDPITSETIKNFL